MDKPAGSSMGLQLLPALGLRQAQPLSCARLQV